MNKYIYTLLFLFFTAISFGSQALAADTPPAALGEDMVRVEDSSFIIDKHLYCRLSLPLSLGGGTPFKSFGMHVRFSAPSSGLISRDNFVALSMRLFTEVRIRLASEIPGLTTEQAMLAMQCRETVSSENKKGYDYHVKMTYDGVENRIKNKRRGTEHVTSEPWSAVLPNLTQGK